MRIFHVPCHFLFSELAFSPGTLFVFGLIAALDGKAEKHV